MDTKKTAYLLVFCLFLATSVSAVNTPAEETRYLVKSNSVFWKKSFGVRNEFKDGFTANLNDWHLRLAKVFGVEVTVLPKLYVLADETVSQGNADDSKDDTSGKPSPSPSSSVSPSPSSSPTPSVSPARPAPSAQMTWGVNAVYGNNPIITKTSGGEDVNVGVLDTGIFKDHPDLKNRIAGCKDFTSPKPVVDGKCDDKNGHGTHVAGVIAADGGDDEKGIYGIAPQASLHAYKVCGANGSCWSDDVASAIKAAADNGINIINLSLGGDIESPLIADAVSYAIAKDVLVIAAAGNDGPDLASIDYPAAMNEVVAVGAFDSDLKIAEWSSRGINSTTDKETIQDKDVEFAAPGVSIESTWKDGGYAKLSGTSMATPHVSGLAAKLWQKDEDDPDSATRDLLREFSSDIMPAGQDDASGFGFPHL